LDVIGKFSSDSNAKLIFFPDAEAVDGGHGFESGG
jgi:hypothetical protein